MNDRTMSRSSSKNAGQNRTVKYEFATGETSEVEVSEEIAAFLAACDREEANRDRKERYHCLSIDAAAYEGEDYSDGTTPETMLNKALEDHSLNARVRKALSCLTETQRRRFLLYAMGISFHEIANREGLATHKTVEESIKAARKKIMKNFWKTPSQNATQISV